MINKTFYISNESLYYDNLEKCQKIIVGQTVLFLCTKWRVKCFCKKNTPFYDSMQGMQYIQFNKKHSAFLGTSNLGLQLQFKCFRIFNYVNQHNVPSRKLTKNMVPKVPYRQFGLKCDSGRLLPPVADRERVRRFIIAIHFL
jgi:hypothetical protein